MSELTPVVQPDNSDGSGTKVGKFLASRGMIIIKEMKEIGTLKCEYGSKIHAETLILTTANSSKNAQAKSFGVRLEMIKDGETEDTAVLDFDESEEFCNAVTFIHEAAQRLAPEQRDYIEATFSTKDSIQVGFYQTTEGEQKAFVKLGPRGDSCFLPPSSMPSFRKLIEAARTHLIRKGADQE